MAPFWRDPRVPFGPERRVLQRSAWPSGHPHFGDHSWGWIDGRGRLSLGAAGPGIDRRRTSNQCGRIGTVDQSAIPNGCRHSFGACTEGSQHLLGVVVPLDHNLVAVDSERCSRAIRAVFEVLNIHVIELEPSTELRDQRGLNFVTLGPKKVLMPAECPTIRQTLEAHGIQCIEAEVTEYVKAGGALGCLTAVIERMPWPASAPVESSTEEIGSVGQGVDEPMAESALDDPTDVSDESEIEEEEINPSSEESALKSDLDAPTELAWDETVSEPPSEELSEAVLEADLGTEEVSDADGAEASDSDESEASDLDEAEASDSDEAEATDVADSEDGLLEDTAVEEEVPGQSLEPSEERIRFDDGDEEGWRPPSLMQLSEEAEEEQDSTEVLVEWVLDESN